MHVPVQGYWQVTDQNTLGRYWVSALHARRLALLPCGRRAGARRAALAGYLQPYCGDLPPWWRVRERYKQVLESQEEIGPAQVFYGRFCAQSSAAGQGAALPARREHAARLRSVGAKQKHYYYIKVATYIHVIAGRCITTS